MTKYWQIVLLFCEIVKDDCFVGVNHIQRHYKITGLTLGQQYKLWVSAWTEAGEGPKGKEYNIVTYSEMLSGKP